MPLKLNREEHPGINLTSLIDILFLLIIFFMVSSKFSENEQHIALSLPKVSDAPTQPIATSVISLVVYRDGSVQCDGKSLNLPQLEQHLQRARRLYPETKVTLRGDGQLSLDRLGEVISVVNRTGIKKLDLAFLGGPSMAR